MQNGRGDWVIHFIAVSFTGQITVRLSFIYLLLALVGPGLH